MEQNEYLKRIAAIRAGKSSRPSEEAYAQMERMRKTTNSELVAMVPAISPDKPKQPDSVVKKIEGHYDC